MIFGFTGLGLLLWLILVLIQPIGDCAIPRADAKDFAALIDAALTDQGKGLHPWISRWQAMDQQDKQKWCQRRLAALLVIWLRGEQDGFSGLGENLPTALSEIDY